MPSVRLFPNFAGIPQKPQRADRWVVWAEEVVDGRPTKVPRQARDISRKASTSDRSTWAAYAKAKAVYLGRKDALAGIGYCRDGEEYFFDGDNFFRSLAPGENTRGWEFEKYGLTFATWDWAGKQPEAYYLALLSADPWMEISVMGFGLHAVVRSSSIVASFQADVPGMEHTGVALYGANRYLTVSGATLHPGNYEPDAGSVLEEMRLWVPGKEPKSRIFDMGAQAAPPRPAAPVNGWRTPADLSDTEVIERVKRDPKGRVLWTGGDPGDLDDNSHSGLDLALCFKLRFYGGKDPARIDRLFRESMLYRDKWEREDYREGTISRALEGDVWQGKPEPEPAGKRQESGKTGNFTGKTGKTAAKAAKAATAGNGAGGGTGGSSGEPPPDDEPPAGFPAADDDEELKQKPGGAWRQLLIRNGSGKALNCHANAETAFKEAPEWTESLEFDEFALVIRTRRETPWGETIASWADEHNIRAAIWMQKRGLPVTPGVVAETVYAVARENSRHPLREWLSGLKWDGTQRIDSWLVEYLGVEPSNYAACAGAWWLGQAVARAFHPGAQADYTLVLEGPQGQKKSQALRTLAGSEYFTDQISDFANKDSSLDLQGKWIIEIAEFDRIAHKPSVVKAFLTRMKDRFRPPYGRHPIEYPRQVIFAATVNLEEYFADSSGNRRFWPVRCGEIRLEELAGVREQLWAEAVDRFEYQRERRWPATSDEAGWFGLEQAAREDLDVWHDQIALWADNPSPAHDKHGHPVGPIVSVKKNITVADVLTHCLLVEPKNQTQAMKGRVAGTLKRLGWKRRMSGANDARYRAYVLPD